MVSKVFLDGRESVYFSTFKRTGAFLDIYTGKCCLPTELNDPEIQDYVYSCNVSASNDGNNFGNTSSVIIYNSTCQDIVNNGTEAAVIMKGDYCYIKGMCVMNNKTASNVDICNKCDTSINQFGWTKVCGSETPTSFPTTNVGVPSTTEITFPKRTLTTTTSSSQTTSQTSSKSTSTSTTTSTSPTSTEATPTSTTPSTSSTSTEGTFTSTTSSTSPTTSEATSTSTTSSTSPTTEVIYTSTTSRTSPTTTVTERSSTSTTSSTSPTTPEGISTSTTTRTSLTTSEGTSTSKTFRTSSTTLRSSPPTTTTEATSTSTTPSTSPTQTTTVGTFTSTASRTSPTTTDATSTSTASSTSQTTTESTSSSTTSSTSSTTTSEATSSTATSSTSPTSTPEAISTSTTSRYSPTTTSEATSTSLTSSTSPTTTTTEGTSTSAASSSSQTTTEGTSTSTTPSTSPTTTEGTSTSMTSSTSPTTTEGTSTSTTSSTSPTTTTTEGTSTSTTTSTSPKTTEAISTLTTSSTSPTTTPTEGTSTSTTSSTSPTTTQSTSTATTSSTSPSTTESTSTSATSSTSPTTTEGTSTSTTSSKSPTTTTTDGTSTSTTSSTSPTTTTTEAISTLTTSSTSPTTTATEGTSTSTTSSTSPKTTKGTSTLTTLRTSLTTTTTEGTSTLTTSSTSPTTTTPEGTSTLTTSSTSPTTTTTEGTSTLTTSSTSPTTTTTEGTSTLTTSSTSPTTTTTEGTSTSTSSSTSPTTTDGTSTSTTSSTYTATTDGTSTSTASSSSPKTTEGTSTLATSSTSPTTTPTEGTSTSTTSSTSPTTTESTSTSTTSSTSPSTTESTSTSATSSTSPTTTDGTSTTSSTSPTTTEGISTSTTSSTSPTTTDGTSSSTTSSTSPSTTDGTSTSTISSIYTVTTTTQGTSTSTSSSTFPTATEGTSTSTTSSTSRTTTESTFASTTSRSFLTSSDLTSSSTVSPKVSEHLYPEIHPRLDHQIYDIVEGTNTVKAYSPVLKFVCNFTMNVDSYYFVKWYIDDQLLWHRGPSNNADDFVLSETELTTKYVGINIRCSVAEADDLFEFRSEDFYAGFMISNKDVALPKGGHIIVEVIQTVPIGCNYTDSFQDHCSATLSLYDLNWTSCHSGINVVNDDNKSKCSHEISTLKQSEVWHGVKTYRFELSTVDFNYDDETEFMLGLQVSGVNADSSRWQGMLYDDIKVTVTDFSLYKNTLCYSHVDPHIRTADGVYYDQQREGDFMLYHNIIYDIEIQESTKRCNRIATCSCGVAIRAGRDVFMVNLCGKINYIGFIRCEEGGTIDVEQLNDFQYKVTTPIGTVVVISVKGNMINIDIFLAAKDVGNIEGLCGKFDGNKSNDFVRSDGGLSRDNDDYTFSESWRLNTDKNLFKNYQREFDPWTDVVHSTCRCTNTLDAPCSPSTYRGCSKSTSTAMKCDSAISYTARERREIKRLYRWMKKTEYVQEMTDDVMDITSEEANTLCTKYIQDAAAFKVLPEKVANENSSAVIKQCVFDVTASNEPMWVTAHVDAVNSITKTVLDLSPEFVASNNDLVESFLQQACSSNCTNNGVCTVNGTCHCNPDYFGPDCGTFTGIPPVIQDMEGDGECDIADGAECRCFEVRCDGLFDRFTCRMNSIRIYFDGRKESGTAVSSPGVYLNVYTGKCCVPQGRRKRSIEDNTDFINVFEVSASNDGVTYGEPESIYVYDSSCTNVTNNNTDVNITLNNGFCYIGGECVLQNESSADDSCKICDAIKNQFDWSNACKSSTMTTTTDAMTTSGNEDIDGESNKNSKILGFTLGLTAGVVALVSLIVVITYCVIMKTRGHRIRLKDRSKNAGGQTDSESFRQSIFHSNDKNDGFYPGRALRYNPARDRGTIYDDEQSSSYTFYSGTKY